VFVAAHYDRTARRVTLHVLGPAADGARWAAYPDLHCVAVRTAGGEFPGRAADLATMGRFPGAFADGLVSRARAAWGRPDAGAGPHTLGVHTRWAPTSPAGDGPYLFLAGNTAHVQRADPPWVPFEPTRDGKPLLGGMSVDRAVLAGRVLGLAISRPGERSLVFFHGPDGAGLAESNLYPPGNPFALSPDGQFVARRHGPREVTVSRTGAPGVALAGAAFAGLHNGLAAALRADDWRLAVRVGGFEHTFAVESGRLVHSLDRGRGARPPEPHPGAPGHGPTEYDPARFPPRAVVQVRGWRAVVDRLGQVLLYRHGGGPVAAFAVYRARAAAWAPGGVFWGDPGLIGAPPTPDADRKVGAAITAAGESA
jgi:hypothetical protein